MSKKDRLSEASAGDVAYMFVYVMEDKGSDRQERTFWIVSDDSLCSATAHSLRHSRPVYVVEDKGSEAICLIDRSGRSG